MNITEANTLNTLLRYCLTAPRQITGEVTPSEARAAARTLVERSHKAIGAGLTLHEFDELWPEGGSPMTEPEVRIVDGKLTCPKCGKNDIREVDSCERWNRAELVHDEGEPYIAVVLNDWHFDHDGWICLDCQTRLSVPGALDENVSYT